MIIIVDTLWTASPFAEDSKIQPCEHRGCETLGIPPTDQLLSQPGWSRALFCTLGELLATAKSPFCLCNCFKGMSFLTVLAVGSYLLFRLLMRSSLFAHSMGFVCEHQGTFLLLCDMHATHFRDQTSSLAPTDFFFLGGGGGGGGGGPYSTHKHQPPQGDTA